jgi:hypothetical protein
MGRHSKINVHRALDVKTLQLLFLWWSSTATDPNHWKVAHLVIPLGLQPFARRAASGPHRPATPQKNDSKIKNTKSLGGSEMDTGMDTSNESTNSANLRGTARELGETDPLLATPILHPDLVEPEAQRLSANRRKLLWAAGPGILVW